MNKRRQLAAFRADRAIKAKLQDRESWAKEEGREAEGRSREIANVFLVTAAFLRRVNSTTGCLDRFHSCEVIFSELDTPVYCTFHVRSELLGKMKM